LAGYNFTVSDQNPFFRRFTPNRKERPRWLRWLGAAVGIIALGVLVYNIPFVHERVAWRLADLRTSIVYFFRPPEDAVFVPQEQSQLIASATAQAAQNTAAPTRTPRAATPTGLPTEPPLPSSVTLTGFKYIHQHGGWNLCGPANLAMALTYWGWEGTRNDVEDYVKPGIQSTSLSRVERGRPDKNVMPYEMEDFVDSQVPGLNAVTRVGGELETIKRLLAAGFPVIVEKGYTERDASGRISWLGHYLYVTGYDEAGEYFIVQDVYLRTNPQGTGENLQSSFEQFQEQWRAFNYLFMVIYPTDRIDEINAALGPWADEEWANQHALELAQAESLQLTSWDQYFAWFNVGSSHVRLLQYVDAAFAYDYAFQLYSSLPNDSTERPYRMMWYQTEPYRAYFYSGRYQDVINLANETLNTLDEPTLEESLYWRARAKYELGEIENAVNDMRQTVYLNKNFWAGWQLLSTWGVSP
jgi:hypothetical protein